MNINFIKNHRFRVYLNCRNYANFSWLVMESTLLKLFAIDWTICWFTGLSFRTGSSLQIGLSTFCSMYPKSLSILGFSTQENIRLPNRLSSFLVKSSSTFLQIMICYSWSIIFSSLLFIISANTLRSSNSAFLCSLYCLFLSSLRFRDYSMCSSFFIFQFNSSSVSECWDACNVCTFFPKLISVLYYFSSDLISSYSYYNIF